MPSGGGSQLLPAGMPGSQQPVTTSIPLEKVNSKPQDGEKAGFFHRPHRGRKKANQLQQARERKERKVTVMGRIYNRIWNFSVITRYLLLSFPLGAIIAVPIVLGVTIFGRPGSIVTASGVPIAWVFTWVEVVWVSLWASKVAAKIMPRIFEFLAGAISPGVKKYSLAIRNMELPISLVGWAVTSLATFIPIMTHHPDPKNQCADPTRPSKPGSPQATVNCPNGTNLSDFAPWTGVVQNVLAAITICSLLFLAEKAFVQFVSINYHAMQYDARIKDSKRSVYLLGVLYDASRALFEPFCPEFREEDFIINDSLKVPSRPGKSLQGESRAISGTATPQKLLHNVGRFGDHVTAALGRVAHEISGKEAAPHSASHGTVVEALEEKHSCEALARRIWMSLVVEGKDALFPEDVAEVLADRPAEEAADAFHAVDRDDNGDVTLDEMILTVCEIGRERKAVANSLHNIGSAINVLDNLLLLIVFVGCVLVVVAFLNQNFNTLLVSAGTALLSLSFVFSATAAEILSSCIFLFVKHPYDVDDRVDIDKQELVVERISLLYTVFHNVQTHKTTQAPNSTLNSVWIDNVTRSKAMRERLKIYISFDTPLEDVELLRREMQKFVHEKDNSRDFESEVLVEVTGLSDMSKMELNVEVRHKSNWSNETVRAARRSKFMCALVLALRRVPINSPGGGSASLGSADQPSYSVAVTAAEAEAARKAFAEAKEAKHLKSETAVATASGNDAVGAGAGTVLRNRDQPLAATSETNAMAMLNSRAPAFDPDPLSPSRGEGFSPIDETAEDLLLRRQSTGGKRRQSPHYSQPEPAPQYGGYPPRPSQEQVNYPPPVQQAPPPNYAQYPQGPSQQQQQQFQQRMMQQQQQQQQQQQNMPGQQVGYSGRSQSPASGPRYAYPPGQQQPGMAPSSQPPSRSGPPSQGRPSEERLPRPPPGQYYPGGYGPQ